MAGPTLIQIKRSILTGSTPTLANGELAFTANGDVLFIGSNAVVTAIAGKRVPGVLTANQAIVTNTTNMIDTIMLGNTTINAVVNSSSLKLANSTAAITMIKPDTTQIAGNYYLKADGSWSTVSAGSAAPAGANTNVQYNDSGVTAGGNYFTFDKATNNVTIANSLIIGTMSMNTVGFFAGANVQLTNVKIDIGNSTVNSLANSTLFRTADTTGTANLLPGSLQIQANVLLDSIKLSIGNTTVNVIANSTIVTIANSSGISNVQPTQVVSGNSTTSTTVGVAAVTIGNSTINTVANSTNIRLANSTVIFDVNKPTAAQVTATNYYLASDSTWKQISVSGTLDGLTDVTITTAANNQVVVYDNAAAQWVNKLPGNGFIFSTQIPAIQGGVGLLVNTTGVHVLANNGIVANSTGTWVGAANGITVTAAGVNINAAATSGLIANTTGLWAIANQGLVVNSTGFHVLAANGIVANSLGTWAKQANGISVDAGGINVNVAGTSGLVSNTTGVWVKGANGMTVDASGVGVNVAAGTSGLVSNTTGVWVLAGNGMLTNSTGLHVGASNGISLLTDSLTLLTGSTLTLNTLGVHVNSTLSITDLSLSGNLTVTGTLVTVDATNLVVNDSIISLGRNNAADVLDIGMYGQYNDGTERFTGLIWDTTTDVWELFANSTVEPTTTVDIAATGYFHSTLYSYLKSGWGTGTFIANNTGVTITGNTTYAIAITGNTMTLSTPLAGTSGGTGLASFTSQDILVANTVNGFNKLGIGGTGTVLQNVGGALAYDTLDGGTF